MAACFSPPVLLRPAILLLLSAMIVRRVTGFEPGREATAKTLSTIITYAMRTCSSPAGTFTGVLQRHPRTPAFHPVPLRKAMGHMAWINSWMTAVVFAALSPCSRRSPGTALQRQDPALGPFVLLVIGSWIDKYSHCSSAVSCPTC